MRLDNTFKHSQMGSTVFESVRGPRDQKSARANIAFYAIFDAVMLIADKRTASER